MTRILNDLAIRRCLLVVVTRLLNIDLLIFRRLLFLMCFATKHTWARAFFGFHVCSWIEVWFYGTCLVNSSCTRCWFVNVWEKRLLQLSLHRFTLSITLVQSLVFLSLTKWIKRVHYRRGTLTFEVLISFCTLVWFDHIISVLYQRLSSVLIVSVCSTA